MTQPGSPWQAGLISERSREQTFPVVERSALATRYGADPRPDRPTLPSSLRSLDVPHKRKYSFCQSERTGDEPTRTQKHQQETLQHARPLGRVDVTVVAETSAVTAETIRRDLTTLERAGIACTAAVSLPGKPNAGPNDLQRHFVRIKSPKEIRLAPRRSLPGGRERACGRRKREP